jgi:hypothetical protein
MTGSSRADGKTDEDANRSSDQDEQQVLLLARFVLRPRTRLVVVDVEILDAVRNGEHLGTAQRSAIRPSYRVCAEEAWFLSSFL